MENMAWVETMFPGIDEDEGWEENLRRVVNYDYLLKEYLDWQLRNLSSENFNETDWSNVVAEAIGLQAGTEDLGAALKMWTEDQIAHLSLSAVAGSNSALLQLMAGSDEVGNPVELSLSVDNQAPGTNSAGYSQIKLTADGVDVATSGKITLGGGVVFVSGDGSDGTQISQTVISGGSITTDRIRVLDIEANTVKAYSSITAPNISGGTINGSVINGGVIRAGSSFTNFFEVMSNGWALWQGTYDPDAGTAFRDIRAQLSTGTNNATLALGNSSQTPAVFEKFYSGGHKLWLGDEDHHHGLEIDLETGNYSFR